MILRALKVGIKRRSIPAGRAFFRGRAYTGKTTGAKESVAGVGDEAYFRNNRDSFAEVVAKVGKYTLTVQANASVKDVDTVKAGAVSLAKVLSAKLR